ncbi:Ig-like domain-containing protein [Lysinibacillus fusiformis]|uniref:Ig-like domain-containing protein n=1 Tax=Lysinibacillus fusiformis TaxID=28031 RepID=UPI0023A92510|nr:Ig-like domain-containing protein [Lysinibacillus fusiformis]WEA41763.1 Ig-like domain-containing protein [Lysinibacillus fusiformis]
MKQLLNKIAIVMIAFFLVLSNLPPMLFFDGNQSNSEASAAAPSKPTGSSGTFTVDVEADPVVANPAVYWTQLDKLNFEAVKDGGKVTSDNVSGQNVPKATQVQNTLDLTKYNMPSTFEDSLGTAYSRTSLNKVYLKNDSVKFKRVESFKGLSLTKTSDTHFRFITETGHPYKYTDRKQIGTNSDGKPKYSVRYDTPIDVTWYGQITNQAEMRVVEDSTITIGATKQYKAQVRTKKGAAAWTAWKDVSAYDWKSDKSSVASVSSNGSVKGLANGQAKITATWKDNDFHLQASANVKVTAEDALTITGNLNACFKDGSTTLKAILYKTGGKSSDVTNTATWTSSDTSVATVSKGVVTFKKVGTTTITATAEGKKETVKVTVIDCTVAPPPDPEEPEPPVPDNDPPTVKIEGPLEVKLGETVCYTADASDPDGYITSYLWNEGNMITDDFKSSKICGRFDEIGEHGITVIVEDNGDINGKNVKTANDQMIIKVVGPKPSAYITVGGTLKENRKITAKVADPYGGNPVLHEKVPIVKQTLTIEAVDKSNQNKLFIKENISGNIDTSKIVNFLGKFTGEVKLTSYVENIEGSSDTFETVIDLQPDLAPIVDFETPSLIYREAPNTDGEYASADIVLTDNSYSIDDGIQKRIWRLKYDSNNDGSFDDEEWQLISDANEERFIYNTKKVGKYLVELEVFEKFGQETIDEYVDQTFDKATTDLRHGNSDLIAMETKIFEVNNLAPVASIELEQEKKTVEVQYDVIDSPYSETQLRTMTPYLNQKLADYGLKANVSFAESSVEEIKVKSSGTTFFLRDNGEVYVTASGLGLFGIPHTAGVFTPTNANLPYKIKGLEYGYMGTAIFLTQDGFAYGAGENSEYQIKVDEKQRWVSPPEKIEIPRTAPIKSVSVTTYSATGGLLYLLENGDVYGSGWINGLNRYHVGRRDIVKAELPLKATEITHQGSTGYFLLEDGSVYEQGALDLIYPDFDIPGKVELPSKVRKMYPSENFIHFLMEDGTVYAMGKNYNGQLGDGTRVDRNTPVKIEFPSSVKEVYAKPNGPYVNDGKTLFLLNNGLVYEINGNKPSLLNLPFKTKRIFNNYSNQHFLTEDGEVYARGVNDFGSLGDGTSISRPTPVKISLPARVKNISLGTVSTFFILEDGSIYATGANGAGQLGDGTTIDRATPVKINAFEATKTSSFTHKSDPTYMTTFSNKPMKVEDIKNKISDNQGYFVGATTASNQSAVQTIVKDNGDKGKFIDIGSTYNDANLKAKIQELADYIIDTQKNNKIEVEFLLDESTSGINKAALEQKIANTLKPLINSKDNSIPFESRVTVLTNNYKFKDTYLDGKNRFVVAVKNNSLSADLEKHITATSLANNAHFVGIGASANKKILERIVAKSMKKGTYIDNSNIDAALTELSNYILNEVDNSRGINEAFVTTDEQINFITNFDDFEKDSLYDEYWKFKHELDYFESETGLFPEHDTQIRTPILTFGQTGRYQPHYAAQDDPLRALDNDKMEYFKDYRKWSDEVNNLFVFVHKKPSSDFTFTVDKISGAFTVTSKANDSDKKSIDVGLGAGLKYQQFSWKLKEENDWNEGLPKGNLDAGKSYEVRNTVVDFQNKESITTKILSRNNLPPVAIFESDKLEYEEGEDVQLTNSSYDPNGDDMTATWYIKNSNDDNSKYKEITTGTYQNGKGNQDWNTVIKNLKCSNKKSEEACSYTIKLFVKDKYGDSDETTRSIKVVSVEAIEVGIEAVEVFTAPSIKGLPTYIQLNEEVLVAKEEQAEDARNAFVQITVNKDGKYYMDNSFKVKELVEGVQFMIPPTELQVDSAYDFEFEISSDDESIVINPGAEKISLNARTAEEKNISSKDIDLTYKGLVSVKRSINTDQVNTYEVIQLETAELKPTVTGLGHSLDQTFIYELPLNQHYSAEGLMNISSKLSFDEVLIDSNFDAADVVEGKAIVGTVNTDNVVETGAKKETITQTLSFPKVYVESVKGDLYSENQKSVNDSRIKHDLIDGGHKLYIPIWLDDIGKYDINYETTSAIGVNKVKFEISQELDIEAYLFLHMNSSTKEKDKFLIEPVNKKNSFPNGKPGDWSDNDVEWIRN